MKTKAVNANSSSEDNERRCCTRIAHELCRAVAQPGGRQSASGQRHVLRRTARRDGGEH